MNTQKTVAALTEQARSLNDLLVMTVRVPASKEVLEARLAEHMAERVLREKGRGLSKCLSDQWLLRDISILEDALKEYS